MGNNNKITNRLLRKKIEKTKQKKKIPKFRKKVCQKILCFSVPSPPL